MQNYLIEKNEEGIKQFIFQFAGREIRMVDYPGTVLSVESLSQGIYETPLPILVMASIARTQGAFCDVGANIGIYSVLATKTKHDLFVHAFEPLPEARQALTDNLKANGTLSRVKIEPFALSDTDGSASLYMPDAGHGLLETSASLESGFKNVATSIEVQVKTLDNLNFPSTLSVIKVDIEGHETAFLRGAAKTLSEDRPLIFAEMLGGASKHFFNLSKFMRDLEYFPFRMRPDTVIYTKIVIADKGWNYAFIPAEKIDIFRDCCRAHDIEMLRSY